MARDSRIDTLKGLLIILVILGHVITTMDNISTINHSIMGLIYIFHMPLFILLSGYLTKPPQEQSASKMWQGVIKLLLPLIIFQFINATRSYLWGAPFIDQLLMFPYGILWFLLSLILWRITLYYTPRILLNKPAFYLSIAFIMSVLCGLTHLGNFFAIQRTINFYVFFLLGYYFRQGAISQKLWKNNILHFIVAVVLLPTIFILFPNCGSFMNGADHYEVSDIPQKIIILGCSITMSLLVFNLTPTNRFLAVIGKDSLFYYLYHTFIITEVIVPIVKLTYWSSSFPYTLLYTAAIVVILLLMSKIKIFRWLVYPPIGNKKTSR